MPITYKKGKKRPNKHIFYPNNKGPLAKGGVCKKSLKKGNTNTNFIFYFHECQLKNILIFSFIEH